jgi:2'-5' RNA ligase
MDEPSNEADAQVETAAASRPVRVFVGVKIAPAIACELAKLARPLRRFRVRLIATDDIHLTLVPPWNESSISQAIDKIGMAAEKSCPSILTFRRLGYGPSAERPRLLWAECEAMSELAAMRMALLEACGQTDERPFRPHVTLGRLRENGRAVASGCPIDQQLSFMQQVDSVEFFRSPPPGAVGYEILRSFPLGAAVERRRR